uniref:hypothetical protein n=1 Tax=Stappia sp. TaxID=1870903 RepID=UPI003A997391
EGAAMRPVASNLTPSGAALEAAFVWGGTGVDGRPDCDPRVSLDPFPGGASSARLAAAFALVRAATPRRLSVQQQMLAADVAEWQASFPGRYGAWAGLRAGAVAASPAGASPPLSAKLYLELPERAREAACALEQRLAGAPPVLGGRDIRPTMLGLDPQNGGVEVYYRCGRLFPGDLDALMRRFRLPERSGEVVALIERLTRRSVRFELPSWDVGFSVAYVTGDEDARLSPAVFTFYSNAASLLGPDERVRCALMREGRARGWDLGPYAALHARAVDPGPGASASGAQGAGEAPLQRHGLVGAVLPAGGDMRVTATLALPRMTGCARREDGGARSGVPGTEGETDRETDGGTDGGGHA